MQTPMPSQQPSQDPIQPVSLSDYPAKSSIEDRFKLTLTTDSQTGRLQKVLDYTKQLAYVIDQACPDSPEKDEAFRELDRVVLFTKEGILRNG